MCVVCMVCSIVVCVVMCVSVVCVCHVHICVGARVLMCTYMLVGGCRTEKSKENTWTSQIECKTTDALTEEFLHQRATCEMFEYSRYI